MGIYIKDMEMPKNCSVCELCGCYNESKGEVYRCDITMHPIKFLEQRLDNCQLVPVPKHGGLIDVDALVETLNNNNIPYHGDVNYFLMSAPIIIPADKEKESS